ncbi:hypothetical protein [Streptomyces sp. NPDC056987]|uniref:hypothetical protein n=1 Tax=Streptomyces sp. NPDC056987 TaxID=3345988 RepID=UPI00362B9BCC
MSVDERGSVGEHQAPVKTTRVLREMLNGRRSPPSVSAAQLPVDVQLPVASVHAGRFAWARRHWRQHYVPIAATAVALPLYAVWAAYLATGGGDLAAQISWADFVSRHPGSPYSLGWYGGIHVGNYSVIAPQLMALLGVRTVTAGAGIIASWFVGRVFVRSGVSRPLWPALLAVLSLWANVASGRSTFALGVALALVSCLCLAGSSRRLVLASAFSALATLASPVAGLFLLVLGAGWLLNRDMGRAAAVCAPPVAVVALTTLLFPFSGVMPMAMGDMWKPTLFGIVLALLAPREWRTLRFGSAVYASGVVLTGLISSPVGSNVIRLAELFGPPLLLCVLLERGVRMVSGVAVGLSLALSVQWVTAHAVHVLNMSTPVPSWASRPHGVLKALDRLHADRTRVEVVPAVNHRETTVLGPHVNLARGWNRQLDVERGGLFYENRFTIGEYRAWLDKWAVGYVVLPEGEPDWAAQDEAALVRSGPSWLEPVWRDSQWRIYRVKGARSIVSGADASVVSSDNASMTVRVPEPGMVKLRIPYSPWLRTSAGCVERDGDWTRFKVSTPGVYEVGSSYAVPWQRNC